MKLLVIDDDPAVEEGLREAYAGRPLAPEICVSPSAADAHRRLRQAPGAFAVVIANPAGWPGRLSQAVEELRLGAPEAGFLALLGPREPLERDDAVLAGFDDAFVKHARTYPVLARLAVEIAERLALGRGQQRVSRARADAELLLTALLIFYGKA